MTRSQVDSSPETATHPSQTAVTVVRLCYLNRRPLKGISLNSLLGTSRVDGNIGFLVITDNGSTRPPAVFYGDFRQITPQL